MSEARNWALMVAAAGEAATGLALLAVPAARVAGLALIALAIACWRNSPLLGMLFYSAAATLYLAWLGLAGRFAAILLWPAVAVHALLSILLWRSHTETNST